MRATLLDRAIANVAPRFAMQRMAAKQTMAFLNSGYGNHGASLYKKVMRGWNFHGGSAKEDIEDNINVLRQRSRDAYMGVPTATAAIKTMRTNVVAGGLMPAPQIDGEFLGLSDEETERLQAQILREFSLWADTPSCDADGMDDFYQLQQLAFLSKLLSGDAFGGLGFRETPGQPYGLQVRVIEADRVCSPYNMDVLAPTTVDEYNVHRIVQGIETDEEGQVVAYWVSSRHPLAGMTSFADGEQKWTRVEARGNQTGRPNMVHLITRERPGQLRGVPMLAPVLETLKQMGRYTAAEIDAAVISAMFTVFIQSEVPTEGPPMGEMIPAGERVDDRDPTTIEMGTGAMVALEPGEKVVFADPKHPNSGYDAFIAAMVEQAGGAMEEPPEVLMKKFSTSYSAARGALNEFWRVCGMERDWFVSDFCQPIYEAWLEEAVARGRIQAPGFFADPAIRKAYTECTWNGPARTNLNPIQEIMAAEKRISLCISTAQEETQQMTGGNYAKNVRRRAIEARQKKEVDDIMAGEGDQNNG